MNTGQAQPIIVSQAGAGWFSIAATAFIGGIGLFMLGASLILLVAGQAGFGIFLAAMAAFILVLFLYVLRDAAGKIGWRIEIGQDAVGLKLPSGRSLFHRLEPFDGSIPYSDIEAIETRLEASFGNMQRSFWLRLKDGRVIVLGKDRALGTGLASAIFQDTATQIGEHGKLAIRDLGMAEGRSGILGVLFASPPPRDASNLSVGRQTALWARAEMIGRIAVILSIVVAVASAISLLT